MANKIVNSKSLEELLLVKTFMVFFLLFLILLWSVGSEILKSFSTKSFEYENIIMRTIIIIIIIIIHFTKPKILLVLLFAGFFFVVVLFGALFNHTVPLLMLFLLIHFNIFIIKPIHLSYNAYDVVLSSV